MPGIAGIVGQGHLDRLQALVGTMLASMRHERDWLCRTHFAPRLGVHAGWVGRSDSFAAEQSIVEGADGLALLFCGECATPERAGTSLLRSYETSGKAFVAGLNGLFSGLLIDSRRGEALLFNDRYGSERLYVARHDGLTFFASEAKALLAVIPALRSLDDRGVADWLAYGSTLEGRTLFRGVSQLPGASLWIIGDGGSRIAQTRYFDPRQWEEQPPLTSAEFSAAFAETFERVLPSYLRDASRVGISITGGLDTRMIMACLPTQRLPSVAYTFAGATGETRDCRIGARVAGLRGLGHRTLRIGDAFLREYARHVDRTVFVTDGCAGALAAHELPFAGLARRLAPVRLTGNFGSEVLRSMSTLKPIGLDGALLDADWRAALPAPQEVAARHPVTQAAFREIPWHLFGTLAAARSQLTFRTPYLDNEVVALAYRAPDSARRSPATALALIGSRQPPLADVPTDRGLTVNGNRVASLARRAFAEITFKLDYLDKEGLPDSLSRFDAAFRPLSACGLLGQHKFLPYRRWYRRELAPHLRDVLGDARRLPYWNGHALSSLLDEHVRGRRNRLHELNAVVTLEAVDRLLIRDLAGAVETHTLAH